MIDFDGTKTDAGIAKGRKGPQVFRTRNAVWSYDTYFCSPPEDLASSSLLKKFLLAGRLTGHITRIVEEWCVVNKDTLRPVGYR
jgi:hypothetical protein